MDDGYKHGKGVVLCTESFTRLEVELLRDVLISKFGLTATLHVRHSSGEVGYRLYISGKSQEILQSLIRPYLIPSMLYKLDGGKAPEDLI